MEADNEQRESTLFLVRLWMDGKVGEGTGEEDSWHGKVQHVVTGKASSFSSQANLMQLLATMSSSHGVENNGRKVDTNSPEPNEPDPLQ